MVRQLLVNAQKINLKLSSRDIDHLAECGHSEAAPSVQRSLHSIDLFSTSPSSSGASARVKMNKRYEVFDVLAALLFFQILQFSINVKPLCFLGSWEELILQLAGGITQHGEITSADKLALADIIDCVKWEISSIFQIPGRTISVVLDLESTSHYTLHLDFTNEIMDTVSVDPWSVLGRSL